MQGMPQGFTPAIVPATPRPQRGGLLTVLLVLITLGALAGIAGSLLAFAGLQHVAAGNIDAAPGLAPVLKLVMFMILLATAQLGCAIGMWSWKKWGVLGYVGMGTLLFLASAKIDAQHHFAYSHLIFLGLVLAAALPKWQYFEG